MDWNNDGHLDILSGCYWTDGAQAGHIYVLYGNGTLDFEEAVPVLNEAGKPLANVILNEEESNAGNAAGDQITDAICTQQFVVDYNGNGILDLVNGSFGSNFFLYLNHGTNEEPKLSANPVKIPVDFKGYHAAPHFCDWNNDGKLEMLTGSGNGGVLISYNQGTREEPVWSPFKQLIPESKLHQQTIKDPSEVKPGPSTRVWAVDFNGNGRLDLLVGDSTTIITPAEGLTEEEFQEKEENYEAQLGEIGKRQMKLFEKYQKALNDSQESKEDDEQGQEAGDRTKAIPAMRILPSKDSNDQTGIDRPDQDEDEIEDAEKIMSDIQALQSEMMDLMNARREWCNEQRTGHVWLYLRKAPTVAANRSTPASSSPE